MPVFGHVEDLVPTLLRNFFEGQGANVVSAFETGMPLPIIVARQDRSSGMPPGYLGDARFMMPALLSVDTITQGPDADLEGADLQEAVRIALHEAWHDQLVIPGAGYIGRIENSSKPSRVSDWATAQGPVQYSSLPQGALRYEANYRLLLRPDNNQANTTNPYVRHF